jgi:hypothetical protein
MTASGPPRRAAPAAVAATAGGVGPWDRTAMVKIRARGRYSTADGNGIMGRT